MEQNPKEKSVNFSKADLIHFRSVRLVGFMYFLYGLYCIYSVIQILFRPHPPGTTFDLNPWLLLAVFLVSFVYIFSGLGLRKGLRWARIVVACLSGLGLVMFPIGTIFGVGVLYLLFSERGRKLFSSPEQFNLYLKH